MRILVLGSGGREHALTHTFYRQGHTVYCLPGNGGTQHIAEPLPVSSHGIDVHDFDRLVDFVTEQKIDLTVVGPEDLLNEGIANVFAKRDLPLFGPTHEAAALESSKAWSKAFMTRYGIPTAGFSTCSSEQEAFEAIKEHFVEGRGVVVKPSGLTGGKGVVCCTTHNEAKAVVQAIMRDQRFGAAGEEVVVEECLTGPEVSLLAFCDGFHILPMITAQDHKRVFDGDKGPNTGGMGAYAPVPFVTEEQMEQVQVQIVDKTLEGLKQEWIHYTGIIYFGLMFTQDGPKVLEYNCRFGDPETQAVLPLLESDLAQIMLACCKGDLESCELAWRPSSSCCVVVASKGYPEEYQVGEEIRGVDGLDHDDLIVFHAGTKRDSQGRIISSGGRVLGVTGIGATLHDAAAHAYDAIDKLEFSGGHYRTDIGLQGIKTEPERSLR